VRVVEGDLVSGDGFGLGNSSYSLASCVVRREGAIGGWRRHGSRDRVLHVGTVDGGLFGVGYSDRYADGRVRDVESDVSAPCCAIKTRGDFVLQRSDDVAEAVTEASRVSSAMRLCV
jgi:hypothetical protein